MTITAIPTLVPVTGSSNVAAKAYDAGTRTLFVQFHSRPTIYGYKDVPVELAEAFDKAQSPTRFVNTELKNVFDFEKIEPEDAGT